MRRGVHFAGGRVSDYPIYSRLSAVVLAGARVSSSPMPASITGPSCASPAAASLGGAGGFHDPIFGKPVTFYLFDLPFWSDLRGYIFAVVIVAILVYWLVARGWQLRFTLPDLTRGQFDFSMLRLSGGLESQFLRGALAFFLIALACPLLSGPLRDGVEPAPLHGRHRLHGRPFRAAALLAGDRRADRRRRPGRRCGAGSPPGSSSAAASCCCSSCPRHRRRALREAQRNFARAALHPDAHRSHPRRLRSLQPHRAKSRCTPIPTRPSTPRSTSPCSTTCASGTGGLSTTPSRRCRPCAPTTPFTNTDVDRYTIDGQYRQVLLSAARARYHASCPARNRAGSIRTSSTPTATVWCWRKSARSRPTGQPVYLIEDMPPVSQDAVAEDRRGPNSITANCSRSRSSSIPRRRSSIIRRAPTTPKPAMPGKGGFPISSLLMRAAAALRLRRFQHHPHRLSHRPQPHDDSPPRARARCRRSRPISRGTAIPTWSSRPKAAWSGWSMATPLPTSHPFSREIEAYGGINYMRNSVKATIDAYDGETHLYVFDPADPVIDVLSHAVPVAL